MSEALCTWCRLLHQFPDEYHCALRLLGLHHAGYRTGYRHILAFDDIVAIEHASLSLIKTENFLPAGVPIGYELGEKGHLFERIHGKDPYVQLRALEKLGMGSFDYTMQEIC